MLISISLGPALECGPPRQRAPTAFFQRNSGWLLRRERVDHHTGDRSTLWSESSGSLPASVPMNEASFARISASGGLPDQAPATDHPGCVVAGATTTRPSLAGAA